MFNIIDWEDEDILENTEIQFLTNERLINPIQVIYEVENDEAVYMDKIKCIFKNDDKFLQFITNIDNLILSEIKENDTIQFYPSLQRLTYSRNEINNILFHHKFVEKCTILDKKRIKMLPDNFIDEGKFLEIGTKIYFFLDRILRLKEGNKVFLEWRVSKIKLPFTCFFF